jgi:GDPmannose 4,6-dehydratase
MIMNMTNKNVLITGISGFVGSNMAKHLLNEKAKVFGLVRRRADCCVPKNIKYLGFEKEVELLEGDLLDISSIGFALDKSKPDFIFHLGAQSFVPRSFSHPLETSQVNSAGTSNLLEAIRIKNIDPVVIFAGSSEEYGLVISSQADHERALAKYGVLFPEPQHIPELPINELNPLRPMSPYAVSKVYGEFLMRNYQTAYGMKTVISRAFNHEGAGRGIMFVTSAITQQVMKLKLGETDRIVIGNVNAFRDWSHVQDIIGGYCLLAEKGRYGDVYVQGSQRTNSVLSYILMSLECAGYAVNRIETLDHNHRIDKPTEIDTSEMFGTEFEKTRIDRLILQGELEFQISDRGIVVDTNKGNVVIQFDEQKFRRAEVPVLLSNTEKIRGLGFEVKHTIRDIIGDQLNYYMEPGK